MDQNSYSQDRLDHVYQEIADKIPVSQFFEFKLREGGHGAGLRLFSELSPHVNHHGTVFGGSLASLGIIGGYALTYLLLQDHREKHGKSFDLVIQENNVEYFKPVTRDFFYDVRMPSEKELRFFEKCLMRRSKARVTIILDLVEDGELKCRSTCVFVAKP